MNWIPLNLPDHVRLIEEISHNQPQIIFKHSTSCSISTMAKLRLESNWDFDNVDTYYLDLLSYKPISNLIADHFEVHHESPQVLLIMDGECVYDSSHFDITVEELKEALAYATNS